MFFLLSQLFACSSGISDSDSWKFEKLYADNWRFLARNPDLLEDKFQKMSDSRYAFMRGTLSIYLGHVERRSQERLETHFLNIPEATLLPILGDAHPENITLCADPSQEASIEFVDLDSSDYGPWLLDLRRSAMSFRLFSSLLEGCDCEEANMQALLNGYWASMKGEGSDLFDAKVINDLLEEALEEGEERKKFYKYTEAEQIKKDAELDEYGKGILALSAAEEKEALAIFETLFAEKENINLLDMARRYGMGVSSLPAIRYVFLWQEGENIPQLSLAREVLDAPIYPGRMGYMPVFESNAHRVDILREQLWNNPESNPDYRTMKTAEMDFKLQRWSSYFQDIESEKIQEDWDEGKLSQKDIEDLAFIIGALLGQIHAKGTSLSGGYAQEIILEDIRLGGGEEALFSEIQMSSELELQQLISDHEWFQQERQLRGSLLGMEVWR